MAKLREFAYLRHDICAYCGEGGGTIDHIVPTALGGTDDPMNLTGSCEACNGLKGPWPLLPFLLLRNWAVR